MTKRIEIDADKFHDLAAAATRATSAFEALRTALAELAAALDKVNSGRKAYRSCYCVPPGYTCMTCGTYDPGRP